MFIIEILDFLSEEGNLDRLDAKIHLCRDLDSASTELAELVCEENPTWFDRDTGSDILRLIADTITPIHLIINLE